MRVKTRSPLNLSAPADPAGEDKSPESQAQSAAPAANEPADKPLVRARARMSPAAVTYRTTRRPPEATAPEAQTAQTKKPEPRSAEPTAPQRVAKAPAEPARTPASLHPSGHPTHLTTVAHRPGTPGCCCRIARQ